MQTNRRIMLQRFVPLTVVVLVGGLYLSSLDNPMIMEDQQAISLDEYVRGDGGWLEAWVRPGYSPSEISPIRYQPVTAMSYRLNNRLTGMSPIGFRSVNIALLGLLGLMTVCWLHLYTDYPAAPLLGALLFVAHPLNAETINHLVGRGELLAMIGVVGFLGVQRLALMSSSELQLGGGYGGRVKSALCLLFFMVAGVLFAVLSVFGALTGLILVPLAILQPFLCRAKYHWTQDRLSRMAVIGGWMAVGGVVWIYFEGYRLAGGLRETLLLVDGQTNPLHASIENPLIGISLVDRLPAGLSLVWFYFGQVFWPDMRTLHWSADVVGWDSREVYYGLGVLVFCVIWLMYGAYRRRWQVLGIGILLSQFILASQLAFIRVHYASNLLAMPFILGVAVVVASVIDRATEPQAAASRRSTRRLAVAVIPTGLIVIVMALTIWDVNQRWFSSARLMAWELSKQPGVHALRYSYGRALTEVGEYTKARFWLELAISDRPESVRTRHALALTNLMLGDTKAANHQYLKVIEMAPKDCIAHTQVAMLALSGEDMDIAAFHMEQAKLFCPHDADVMYNHARLADGQGNHAEAIRRYEMLLRRWPEHVMGAMDLERLKNGEDEEVEADFDSL